MGERGGELVLPEQGVSVRKNGNVLEMTVVMAAPHVSVLSATELHTQSGLKW